MASSCRRFLLLLWKNYLLQKRRVLVTILEVLMPTLFALILIWIRRTVHATPVNNATVWSSFNPRALPSSLCPASPLAPCTWRLYYTPNNNLTTNIMTSVQEQLGTDHITGIRAFPSEEEMVSDIMKTVASSSTSHNILGGLVFLNWNGSEVPHNLTYKLRLSASPRNGGNEAKQKYNPFGQDTRWMTTLQFPLFQKVGPREKDKTRGGLPGYMREGFLSVQLAVNEAITSLIKGSSVNKGIASLVKGNSIDEAIATMVQGPSVNEDFTSMVKGPSVNQAIRSPVGGNATQAKIHLRRMPYPPYNDDNFVLVVQDQLPLLLMLSFVFSALNIVKDVVHEKERRIKETLKLMGLSNWMHWLAWFVKHFSFLLITVAIITIFFVIKSGPNGAVIGYSSPSVLFVFLLVYSMATISFCFAVSVFFKKANTGAAAGGILFFLSYLPYMFLQPRYSELAWTTKVSTCLISNVAMAYGGQIFGMFEGTGAGVQWASLNKPASVDDDFTLLQVMLMLLLDTFVYGLVTWYVEAVWPGEFGIPLPWYFPVMKSYWCGTVPKEADDGELPGPSGLDTDNFEKDPVGLKAGIQIRGLRKEFGRGEKLNVAVAGTTLNMYEGQITALLGHNGAGKTTTMNMLTGFFSPTSGTALINGYDIRRDMTGVRSCLGLCPQHDVLFDTLTVEEHLVFFALVKGWASDQLEREVTSMLRAVGLLSKRKALSKTLSGGQKRKLSVAMALIGGSKVVILDEPTSGMDPNARRHLWDVLQRHRAGRTMLLTTHFMDEADLLGDRVAIMADGVIQCCGSSLFLKNKYGAGYHMVIVKQEGCDVSQVTQLVRSLLPAARLESNISAELSYILPAETSGCFEQLFGQLEKRRAELNIASYGVSVTTMEEVFLRVGEEQDDGLREKLQQTEAMLSGDTVEPVFNVDIVLRGGITLLMQQFQAMFVKRMRHTMRNWLVTSTQLIVPLVFTIIGLVVIKTNPAPGDSPPLTLSLAAFRDNMVACGSGEAPSSLTRAATRAYAGQFSGLPQTHAEYVNNDSSSSEQLSMMDFLEAEGTRSLATYVNHYVVAAEFSEKSNGAGLHATGFFNDQGFHTVAVSLAALQTGLLQWVSGRNLSLTAVNHPLPRTLEDKMNDELGLDFTGFTISFHVMFGLAFLISSFVLFLIKERATKAKHCQFVSGVGAETFWASTFVWDFINFLVPVALLMFTFLGFGITAYTEGVHWLHILLLFALYGWACLPFMYLLSFIFTVPASGFVWLSIFNVLSGIGTVIAVKILAIPQLDTAAVGTALKWVFLVLLPNFNLGQGLEDYYTNHQYLNICASVPAQMACQARIDMPCCKEWCTHDCLHYSENYLTVEDGGIGRMLIFLALQGFMYFVVIFFIELGIFRQLRYAMRWRRRPVLSRSNSIHSLVQEDDDVQAERERIITSSPLDLSLNHSLVLKELTKYYDELLAVDRLSFAIRRSECFGLLGVNGAGKTTTFKMLTGDEAVSAGNAYLQGFDIRNNIKHVQQRLGYCPQFDALVDQLTGRETLTMYARIRGVASFQIPGMVQQVIRTLLLTEHADKLVKDYSGGNKRKLSAAVALVGDPPVILLDEPTTGMDPVARRLLWETLSRLRASGTTLVLTSHSMEECEALCTQIAIMVNGQLKCFGSTQHLKNKFGQGFTLLVRVGLPSLALSPEDSADMLLPDVQPFMDFIESTFRGSVLKDIHQGLLHYHVPEATASLAELFGTLEANKHRFHVEDYSVSQTTLEQVFINFARSQVEPLETPPTRCQQCGQGAVCCGCLGCCCRSAPVAEDEEDLLTAQYEAV